MSSLMLNQLQASKVRMFTPWRGVWFADVDVVLDLTGIPPIPGTPCILTVGLATYTGTVDADASGSFAGGARVRVVGGMGGWSKNILPLHIHNPAGVLSTMAYTTAASQVLESVVDVIPKPLGTDFCLTAGPASRVFGDVDWYVTPVGITTVGPRVPLPMDPLAVIVSYDPLLRTVEIASDNPITPGTILVDTGLRFTSPLTVRDVEQVWDAGSARATCWVSDTAGSRLQKALAALVIEKAGVPYLKSYRYRVVVQDPTTEDLTLQIVDPTTGAPDALSFAMWPGVPGVAAKLMLGSEVLVGFVSGDPTQPVVTGFKLGQPPIELGFFGAAIKLGLTDESLDTGTPIALAPPLEQQVTAIGKQVSDLQSEHDALETFVGKLVICLNAIALATTPPTTAAVTALGSPVTTLGNAIGAAKADILAQQALVDAAAQIVPSLNVTSS